MSFAGFESILPADELSLEQNIDPPLETAELGTDNQVHREIPLPRPLTLTQPHLTRYAALAIP